jgi:hypothetical protein
MTPALIPFLQEFYMKIAVAKPKTFFEQVPLEIAKKAIREYGPGAPPIVCGLCAKSIALENCKIDENGRAVHEDCYFYTLSSRNLKRNA